MTDLEKKTESDFEWMTEDYLRLEECDNSQCLEKGYSTCNIRCTRCEKTNEALDATIWHCLDCLGPDKRYHHEGDDADDWYHGFDMCDSCYLVDPHYLKWNHQAEHHLKKVSPKETIHYCSVCQQYYCEKCSVSSNGLVDVQDILDDTICRFKRTICKSCLAKFT